tara:strand:+ start:214 stop:1269 length:1056 start_codon:yes stop_codon:yes gene_type:complete
MLAINEKDVDRFILQTKAQLKTQGHDYDELIQNTEFKLINQNDVEAFISDCVERISKKPNNRKKKGTLKYFNPEKIKTCNSLDQSFIEFLRERESTFLTNGNLQLHMQMDFYKFRDIVFEWEQTCQQDQYRWWSNPVTNLIAYQVNYLSGTLPFSFQQSDKYKNVLKPKRQNASKSFSEVKNDYGVIYLLTHKITKKHYVGQTKRKVDKRFREHSKDTSGCRLLRNAIKQDGFAAFDRKVLAICKISDLDRLEAFFINKYNCVYPNGYNISAGNLTFIHMNTEIETLISYIKVDDFEVEMLILESCKDIQNADEEQNRHDILKRIKECHPDKTDDQEKNNECIELLRQLNT